jgi:hypothetical protein
MSHLVAIGTPLAAHSGRESNYKKLELGRT